MKLDSARLCLDCEDVHESQVCPTCGSEAFAYLTRWVQPAADRIRDRRPDPTHVLHQPRSDDQLEAYRQLLDGKPPSRTSVGLVAKGAIGLAALGLAGWAWRAAGRARGQGPRGDDPTG